MFIFPNVMEAAHILCLLEDI